MFEVQTLMGNDWENCWSTHHKDGSTTPSTYATREEAQAAIDEHLQDVREAVAEGDMAEEYDPEDYRIEELKQ